MFVRKTSTPNSPRCSVQIVKSVREGKSVKQKVVCHVGVAQDDQHLLQLTDLAEAIKLELQEQQPPHAAAPEQTIMKLLHAKRQHQRTSTKPLMVDLKRLREEQSVKVGFHEVYGELYRQLKFDRLLSPARYRASHQVLMDIVMARIAEPLSKRASVHFLARRFGVALPLEKVYRMMDLLDDKKVQRLKTFATRAAQALFRQPLDVLFFDCTTLYFESLHEDELKQYGYSKDGKFNQVQVLLALMVTRHGLPVSYEVFPGATFEGHTLMPVIAQMKTRYTLNRVICVADRGMLSEANLQALEEAGCGYIVGGRLKQLPRRQREQVLDKSAYQTLGYEDAKGMELTYRNRRLVVSYSLKRAEKDRHDRQQAVDKLLAKLAQSDNPKALLNTYGYKKFVTFKGKAKLSVDQDKIEEAAQWDGLHGVITNVMDVPSAEILSHYRGLWQVEESFRLTKHDLQVRPIFHWTPARIRAHIAITFMALTCIRHLSYRMSLQHQPLSPAAIGNELRHVSMSIWRHQDTEQCYVMPSSVSREARKIYRLMGLKPATCPYPLD